MAITHQHMTHTFMLQASRLVSDTSWSPPLFSPGVSTPSQQAQRFFHNIRFNGANNPNVLVAPSGLGLVNKKNQITEVPLTRQCERGTHCWEFFCPQDCYGITFGIRNSQTQLEETFEFLSATSKRIILKLNMDKLTFKAWINLAPAPKNLERSITPGVWVPFVRLRVKDSSLLLNPNPQDPEGQSSGYNPWLSGESELPTDFQVAPQVIQEERITQGIPASSARLISLGEDSVAIATNNQLRIVYRNQLSKRFQLENIAKVTKGDKNLVEICFKMDDFEEMRRFCSDFQMKFFKKSVRKVRGNYYIEYEIEEWIAVLKNSFFHCDSLLSSLTKLKQGEATEANQLPSEANIINIYRILLEKLEQLRPCIAEPLKQLDCLESTQVGQWDYTQAVFRKEKPQLLISKSLLQNNLPPLSFKSDIKELFYSDKFLILETEAEVELLNHQYIPLWLMNLDLKKGFNKREELEKFSKTIESIKIPDPYHPRLYKLLEDCLVESKLAKRIVKGVPKEVPKEAPKEPPAPSKVDKKKPIEVKKDLPSKESFIDKKMLDSLVAMGFPISQCKKALSETKNVSADAALEYILSTPVDYFAGTKSWPCSVCTLINTGDALECIACSTPKTDAEETTEKQEQQELKEQEVVEETKDQTSNDIEQECQEFILIETGVFYAPLVVVGVFSTVVRLRLVGASPQYLKSFYVTNEQSYIDLTDLSAHKTLKGISEPQLTHLEHLVVGKSTLASHPFGWITLDDTTLPSDSQKTTKSNNNLVIGDKMLSVMIQEESVLNFKKSSLKIQETKEGEPQKKLQQQTGTVVYDQQISINGRTNVDINLTFTQLPKETPVPLSLPKVLSCKTETLFLSNKDNILQLSVECAPTGCNFHYPETSLLYCPSPNYLVLRHLHNKYFVPQQIELKSSGYILNKCVKRGFIYLTNHIDRQPILKYQFSFSSDQQCVLLEINSKVACKYLVIQPLLEEENRGETFEITVKGILGTVVEGSPTLESSVEFLQKYLQIDIEGITKESSFRIDNFKIKETLINDKSEVDHLNNEGLNIRIQEYLKCNVPVDILLKVRLEGVHNFDRVRIKSVSLNGWRIVSRKITSPISASKTKSILNSIAEDIVKTVSDSCVTMPLLSLLQQGDVTPTSILQQMSTDALFDMVNLSQLSHKQLASLVREVSQSPLFEEKVKIASVVGKIQSGNVTPVGLEFIFEVLKISSREKDVLCDTLGLCLKQVESIRDPQYKSLRKRGDMGLGLEKELFSDFYMREVENKRTPQTSYHNRIMSKFVTINSSLWRRYILDLTNLNNIEYLLLSFEENQFRQQMMVKVYKVKDQEEKELIFTEHYNEWVWQQVSRVSSSPEEALNTLRIDLPPTETRYLIIEISFSLFPHSDILVPSGCTTQIIPQVFGSYQGEAESQFIQLFDTDSTKPTFLSHSKFHTISRFTKYNINRDKWNVCYYDNDDVSLEPSSLHKRRELVNGSNKCLDFYYTVAWKTMDVINKDNVSLEEQTLNQLFKVLVRDEEGPVSQKAIHLIRSTVNRDQTAYLELLKKTTSDDTIKIFSNVPLKIEAISSELKQHPNKTLLTNFLLLLEVQRVEELDDVDMLVKRVIEEELYENAAVLLELYPWTQESPLLLKNLLKKDKALALKLVQKCKSKEILIRCMKEWATEDEDSFYEALFSLNIQPSEDTATEFKTIVSQLLNRRGKSSYKQLSKLIKVSKLYGLEAADVPRLLTALTALSSANDLFESALQFLKADEANHAEIIQYLIGQTEEGVTSSRFDWTYVQITLSKLKNSKLSADLESRLLKTLLGFLNHKCTVGGVDGLHLPSPSIHQSLQIALSLSHLTNQPVSNDLLEPLTRWYLLNGSFQESNNPTITLFHHLRAKIDSLLLKANPIRVMQTMLIIIKQLQQHIQSTTQNQHKLEVDSQVMKAFQHIYTQLDISCEDLAHIMIRFGTFEYMINRIMQSSGRKSEVRVAKTNLANSLKVIKGGNAPKDWMAHKNGSVTGNCMIINYRDDSSFEEFILKSETPFLLDNILIAFVAGDSDQKTAFPHSVHVWTGSQEDDLENIGKMEVVQDGHYVPFATRLHGINLKRVDSSTLSSLTQGLNQISPTRCIKFVVTKPVPISVEGTIDVPFKTQAQCSKVSFLSIVGSPLTNVGYVPSLLPILPLLSRLSTTSNKNALTQILQQELLVETLKQGLASICSSIDVPEYSSYLYDFIIAVSRNDLLGDFIIDRYLNFEKPTVCSKIVSEIVISNYDLLEPRLLRLHNFVLEHVEEDLCHFFIARETNILHLISKDLQSSPALITLQMQPQHLKKLLDLLTLNIPHKQQVEGYVATLLLLKPPLQLSKPSSIIDALEYCWSQWRENYSLRSLLSTLVIGSPEGSQWILDHNRLDTLIDSAKASISHDKPNLKSVINLLELFTELCYSPPLKSYIEKKTVTLDLFRQVTVLENQLSLNNPANTQLRKVLVEFVVNSILGTTSEKEFAIVLKESLDRLSEKFSEDYVKEVFLPILNSPTTVPVCLEAYDWENKRYTLDPCLNINKDPLSLAEPPAPQLPKLTTKILSETPLSQVQDRLPKNQAYNLVYYQSKDNAESSFNTIKDKLFSDDCSFVMIIEAEGYLCKKQLALFYNAKSNPKASTTNHITREWTPGSFVIEFTKFDKQQEWKPKIHQSKGKLVELGAQKPKKYGDTITDLKITKEGTILAKLSSAGLSEVGDGFKFLSAEYFTLKPVEEPTKANKPGLLGEVLSTFQNPHLMDLKYVKQNSSINNLRKWTIYHLPKEITIGQLKNMLKVFQVNPYNSDKIRFFTHNMDKQSRDTDTLGAIIGRDNTVADIQYNIEDIFNGNLVKNLGTLTAPMSFLPKETILSAFERQGGIEKLISVISNGIKAWKKEDMAKRWQQYIEELKSFSNFPQFFSVYMKEKETLQLLLDILVGLPDKEEPKKWQEMENKAIKQLYKIVSDVLNLDNTVKLRDYAIQHKFLATILERLHLISKQGKRTYIPDYVDEEDQVKMDKTVEEDVNKKVAKKKGTGYGTDSSSNTKWATSQKQDLNKETSDQVENTLSIIDGFLNVNNWKIPESVQKELLESCLFPLIENTLRAGTLLEISKDSKKVMAVLNILVKIIRHKELVPCLLKLSPKYQPSQSESVVDLLKSLANTAQIFLSCLKQGNTNTTEQNKFFEQSSKRIIEVTQKVEEAIFNYQETDQNSDNKMNDILSLPLAKKYRQLLKNLKFDYINMQDQNGKIKHHYTSYSSTQSNNVNKTIRLAQELADLSTSLPTEHTNAIYVRCDKSRIDYMQALIIGANGTPYGHGAFLFDIYFEDNYPNGPPKVNLTTTGGGKVRFNPNLYACGKVCLSLLGTWRGNASENWDPKLSTLLQVLMSIQAIIMSDDIYFNEPGFEGEQGSEEGNKKNEAYSNIVRYCNLKYAMVESIRKPPNGFETVIKRHFYLKKDEILEEVEKWVKFAEKREASYAGLVNDHNNNWCTEFKVKNKYLEMLKEAQKELKAQLQKLSPPSIQDITPIRRSPVKVSRAAKTKEISKEANLEEVDVTFDSKPLDHKELDVNDEKVKDRWSRYIGAMGIDAVSKQSKASILICGMGPFSMEVTKNLILSGCKRLTICDPSAVTLEDLSGGFFFNEADVGKNRVKSCIQKLQELNQYVRVDELVANIADTNDLGVLKDYNIVLMTEGFLETQVRVSNYCRQNGIKFVLAECRGAFFRLFNDFGTKFEVLDKNGEEAVEVMIKHISQEEKGKVTLLDGTKHPFEDGEVVVIKEVSGMRNLKDENQSLNGTLHKVQTINSSSFYIQSTLDYSPYLNNGTAKNIKLPVEISFPPLESILTLPSEKLPFDESLTIYDFSKIEDSVVVFNCFITADLFFNNHKRYPEPWNLEDATAFVELYKKQTGKELDKARLVTLFSMTFSGNLPPLCAFFGGFVAQQVIKAITQKFSPVKSLFCGHFSEVIPHLPKEETEYSEFVKGISHKEDRAKGLEIVIGRELIKKLESCKVFVIGAGAIGCELLKNFAMINLSCGEEGMITVTDPDHIETSNLNRQFLFREKHVQKPKSSTAAASVIQMNPLLKGHISARLDKVHDQTKPIYSDSFFKCLNIVANALDNVQARRYVDQRCVDNKVALLESGTLGPKGHVQVIIPHKTESYGSRNDPTDEGGEIPHCTLKMFPEETLHCIEWARDKFGQKFSLQPKNILKFKDPLYKTDSSEAKVLSRILKQLKKKPTNFDDCIHIAIKKFYKYFRNDIMQLLYTYPLDAKTKNGDPFWKLPKRPPMPIQQFDPIDPLHSSFVASYAVMLAKTWNLAYPKGFRTEKERLDIAKIAAKIKVEPFIPSDKKAREIMEESKQKGKDEECENVNPVQVDQNDSFEEIKVLLSKEVEVVAEEFEKDDDSNGHIDFIYSMANLRSLNYKLNPMDWVTTKIKAGRIVPALSTTTTAIAGLQTLELIKYLASLEISQVRNTFLNLAVPIIQLSEPGEPLKVHIKEGLSFTVWDKWEVKCSQKTTLQDLFQQLLQAYKLSPRDIFQQSKPIFLNSTFEIPGKEKDKELMMKSRMVELVEREEGVGYVDVIVTFALPEEKQILKEVPKVRLHFSE